MIHYYGLQNNTTIMENQTGTYSMIMENHRIEYLHTFLSKDVNIINDKAETISLIKENKDINEIIDPILLENNITNNENWITRLRKNEFILILGIEDEMIKIELLYVYNRGKKVGMNLFENIRKHFLNYTIMIDCVESAYKFWLKMNFKYYLDKVQNKTVKYNEHLFSFTFNKDDNGTCRLYNIFELGDDMLTNVTYNYL